jgi:bacillopeptidase F (M6 metalloprotease family)
MTIAAAAEWIKRIADDERKRDAVRAGQKEQADRKADLVRLHGRRLVDELRATVTRDVEAFRDEFERDLSREILMDATETEGGFLVRKASFPAVSLTVEPNLDAAALNCHYKFTPTNGLPPREDRFDLMFSGDGTGALQLKHHGQGQVFSTTDALSEFLLVPVFTGRPR